MASTTDLNLLTALPELMLAVGAMSLLVFGVFRGDRSTHVVSLAAIALLVFVLLVDLTMLSFGERAFSGLFVANAFTEFAKALVLIGTAVAILMSIDFNEREGVIGFEYPVVMLLAALGMMMMISANDFIALYLGIELQSLSLYVLAAFRRDALRSSEAGLKYFVLGALSSGMLLYGCSLVYGFSANTGFEAVASAFAAGGEPPLGMVAGVVFVAAGMAFKISAVPFHMWTPDVYEGAPTPVTAFFAVAPKIAALTLFARILVEPFAPLVDAWQQVIIVIAIGSMGLGAFAAIAQTNIKRLMAYSSIGHVGFACVGLAAGNEAGVRALLIYLAIYMVMNLGTFALILSMRRGGRMVEDIQDLAGLSRTHPLMAAAAAVLMFSMAGIPPLAGFWSKLYVFQAAVDQGLIVLSVIGVVLSVVSCYYYLRIIRLMYFDDVADRLDRVIGRDMGSVMGVSAVLVIIFAIYPAPVVSGAAIAAAALFGG